MEIELLHGDITKLNVDAIVNAANTELRGGGGVDGAIHRAGGKVIAEACSEIRSRQGGCKVGEAVITTAGKLPAKFVIHTVGPVWKDGKSGEPMLLRNCYLNSLKLASENQLKSIAFPNISTGVYGYPKKAAAEVAIQAVRSNIDWVQNVTFVCFDEENYQIYKQLLN